MTKQEIFNKVYEHLSKQGKSSSVFDPVMKTYRCAYRGENGTMCAVGCLIPDELYSPLIESLSSSSDEVTSILIDAGILQDDENLGMISSFLRIMQRAHDHELAEDGFEEWQERMKNIAKAFDLKVPK